MYEYLDQSTTQWSILLTNPVISDQTPEFRSRRFSWTSMRAKFAPYYATSVDSFYFCRYCMTIIYFRRIFVVLPKEKSFSIYFRGRYTTVSRREPSPQPFNNTVFVDLNDKLGETGVLVNCPGGGGRRRGRCLPQRQLEIVKTFILFYFIYSFQRFALNVYTTYTSL